MMQLLNSLPHQPFTPPHDHVLASLHDIANQLVLESDFSIRHPDYKPLQLPEEAVAHFQQLPLALQTKFWRSRLQSFLYGIYYNGSLRKALAPDADAINLATQQNLENNTLQGVDLNFYERLHANNHGEGCFDPGWKVLRQEENGSLAVFKEGLTLQIEPAQHLSPKHASLALGESVAIRLPRNRVQNGFYLAVSNASSPKADGDAETVRIYFNVSPEGAITVMDALTRQLNQLGICFQFKALYNPSDYDRYDSAVLYFAKHDYGAVQQVIQAIYTDAQADFRPEIPLFTKWLAPGLGLAEEPDQKFSAQESFGTHRCQIVALGLLDAWQNGDNSPETRMKSILEKFARLGIDLDHPYLNANSKQIYMPLALC